MSAHHILVANHEVRMMGPREKRLDDHFRHVSDGRVGIDAMAEANLWERKRRLSARLADALEEAILRLERAGEQCAVLHLRAVLKEADDA